VEIRDPERPESGDDGPRARSDRYLLDDPVTARVDSRERIRGDAREPGRPSAKLDGGDDRPCCKQADGAGAERDPRPAIRRDERRPSWRCGPLECLVLPQDRCLQLLERAAGLDAQLLVEHASGLRVELEGIRLPPGPVEREHQLLAKALPKRMLSDQALELGDQSGLTTK